MDVYTKSKLDYLADTKADIKAALIEKGQAVSDADPFRSYGDKVRAIETGGGGGALPAGVYLSALPGIKPMSKKYRLFYLNGELYATSSGAAGAGYLNYIYKWDGSSWETVLFSSGSTGINGNTVDSVGWNAVELNGKIHFINDKDHVSFDGSTLTVHNGPPYRAYGTSCVTLYQNTIVASLEGSKNLYAWDEASDTWTAIATLSSGAWPLFVIDGELYGIKSKILYRYVNGAMVQVSTTTLTDSDNTFFVKDGALYWVKVSYSTYSYLYRYNLQTDEVAVVGEIPSARYSITFGGDTTSFVVTTTATSDYYPALCMTIVEETE